MNSGGDRPLDGRPDAGRAASPLQRCGNNCDYGNQQSGQRDSFSDPDSQVGKKLPRQGPDRNIERVSADGTPAYSAARMRGFRRVIVESAVLPLGKLSA